MNVCYLLISYKLWFVLTEVVCKNEVNWKTENLNYTERAFLIRRQDFGYFRPPPC